MYNLFRKLFCRIRKPAPVNDHNEYLQIIMKDMNRLVDFISNQQTENSNYSKWDHMLRHYAKEDTCRAYAFIIENYVYPNVPDFEYSTGLDFGCWLGLSTMMLARRGAASMIGVDVIGNSIEAANAFVGALKMETVTFKVIENAPFGKLPLEPESVDWALANDMFSFVNPERFEFLIKEVARALKPGGKFLFIDGNNPKHTETLERLKETWTKYEYGAGGPDSPNGTYFEMRKKYIKKIFPEMDSSLVNKYAKETAYKFGSEIKEYVKSNIEDKVVEPTIFDPKLVAPVIHPIDGRSIGAITDPVELMELFRKVGLEPSIQFTFPNDPTESFEKNLTASGRFYLTGIKV